MKLRAVSIFLSAIFLFAACVQKKKETPKPTGNQGYITQYCTGFTVRKTANYTQVFVHNPWDTAHILQTYILVKKTAQLPDSLPQGILVRTPLERVALSSTVQAASFIELDAQSAIKGVRDAAYINLPQIKDGLADHSIADLGNAASANVEKLLRLAPEALFVEPVQGFSISALEKCDIPLIFTPDYMENSALGRAEWLRFYALFVEKEMQADSLFEITRNRYNGIQQYVVDSSACPLLLTETMTQNIWYVNGGNSFIAGMYHDAGATTPWDSIHTAGSLPLSFEAVLHAAQDADIWLIKYNDPNADLTYERLHSLYRGYAYFKAYKERNIYGCNMAYSRFYEDLPIHPDAILQELAAIFSPRLFPYYTLKYFKKLEE